MSGVAGRVLCWRSRYQRCSSISGPARWLEAARIATALSVLAVAQIGVHLNLFLPLSSGPHKFDNLLALAFRLLIVLVPVFGFLESKHHLDHNTLPMDQSMKKPR